jgi:hypothetical protein
MYRSGYGEGGQAWLNPRYWHVAGKNAVARLLDITFDEKGISI